MAKAGVLCFLVLIICSVNAVYYGIDISVEVEREYTRHYETVFSIQSINYTQNLDLITEFVFDKGTIKLHQTRNFNLLSFDILNLKGSTALQLEQQQYYKIVVDLNLESQIGPAYVYSINIFLFAGCPTLELAKASTQTTHHFTQDLESAIAKPVFQLQQQNIINNRRTLSCNYLSDIYLILFTGWTSSSDLKLLDLLYNHSGCDVLTEGVALLPRSLGVMYYSSSKKILCL